MKKTPKNLIFVCLLTAFVLRGEYITLTDREGRSIKAEIINVVSGNASVKLENGQHFQIPIEKFSDESKKVIENWKLVQATKHREPFRITTRLYRENEENRTGYSTTVKEFDAGYKVTVENTTPMKLPALQVEYIILKDATRLGSTLSQNEVIRGSAELESLGLRQQTSFQTKTVPIKEEETRSGWYVPSAPDKAKDELGGIWIRIMSGDQVIQEFAKPSSLMKELKWDEAGKD